MVMKGIDEIDWFTDRPDRVEGTWKPQKLLRKWDNYFASSKPNAQATVEVGEQKELFTFEMSKPRIKSNKFVFKVKPLSDTSEDKITEIVSEKMNDISLFIDNAVVNSNSCSLSSSNLTGADLNDADLADANLTDANLTDANLSGAILDNATLDEVVSGGIKGQPKSLPDNWSINNGYLIGPKANLTDANLNSADLKDADLAVANLYGTNLTGANLTGSNLNAATLRDANLSDANLSDAIISNAILNKANLSGAILDNATLDRVGSFGIKGQPKSLPDNWKLIDGYLIGPNAKLTKANLNDADLAGANLNKAYLFGASFTNANLINANLSDATMTRANLSGANLMGTTMLKAVLLSATWNNTTCPDGTKNLGTSPCSANQLIPKPAPTPDPTPDPTPAPTPEPDPIHPVDPDSEYQVGPTGLPVVYENPDCSLGDICSVDPILDPYHG